MLTPSGPLQVRTTTVQEHPVFTQRAWDGEADVTSTQAAAAASSPRVRTMMSSVKLSVHFLIDL